MAGTRIQIRERLSARPRPALRLIRAKRFSARAEFLCVPSVDFFNSEKSCRPLYLNFEAYFEHKFAFS